MKEFIALCFTRPVVKRASLTALVVGAILVAINYGDALLHGQINSDSVLSFVGENV